MHSFRWLATVGIAGTLFAAGPSPIPDGTYSLRITHQARLQHDEEVFKPIPADRYEPARHPTNITVQVSGQGQQVLLLPRRISGSLREGTNAVAHFRLTNGLFAGGSFEVERTQAGWSGTFTEYGSGRPILSSVRGPLVQEP